MTKGGNKSSGSSPPVIGHGNMVMAEEETDDLILGHVRVITEYFTDGWIIDSGASRHICKDRIYFKTVKKINKIVLAANRISLRAYREGDVAISIIGGTVERIIIRNILLIPEYTYNLLSVGELTTEGYGIVSQERKI